MKYSTKVEWTGAHRGILSCSNGAVLPFSAPFKLHGEEGVMTPEDAFVGALNTCYMLMFIWAVERMKLNLVNYDCEAEGEVVEAIDRTVMFKRFVLRPKIRTRGASQEAINRALRLAEKYSLIRHSVSGEVVLEPNIILD